MAKRREEMDSAMGPDEEPGEARPAPADEALGLGGAGTEGKPGTEEGGTEPQIPEDVVPPTREEQEPFEVLREVAEELDRKDTAESPPEIRPEGIKPDEERGRKAG
ncbi:MAG: hypothetical protein ACYDCO_15400 [Armatimonadota bacterium]